MVNIYKGVDVRDLLGLDDVINCNINYIDENLKRSNLNINDKVLLISRLVTNRDNIHRGVNPPKTNKKLKKLINFDIKEYTISKISDGSEPGIRTITLNRRVTDKIKEVKYICILNTNRVVRSSDALSYSYSNNSLIYPLDTIEIIVPMSLFWKSVADRNNRIKFIDHFFINKEKIGLNNKEILESVGAGITLTFNYINHTSSKYPDLNKISDINYVRSLKIDREEVKLIGYNRVNPNKSMRLKTDVGYYLNIREDGTVTEINRMNKNNRKLGYLTDII